MPKYSAKQRKMRSLGKTGGPHFIQLFHYLKRSKAYHGLSPQARALLIELIDRYTGINNGMIVLGVREAQYELGCGHATVCRAMREVDDAGLARPTKVGAWRGRQATEWRLMWKRCDKTGDLPKTQWEERRSYSEKPEPLSNTERQRRYREKHRDETEVRYRTTEGPLQNRRSPMRSATEPQKRNSSINGNEPRSATEPHIHIYQGQGDGDGNEWEE
jgi:hypothetical protein